LLSPFPSRIDLLSFPLERFWRSQQQLPTAASTSASASFHTLVSSAQQALDRLLARSGEDRLVVVVVEPDELSQIKLDCRNAVSDLKRLHALLRADDVKTETKERRAATGQGGDAATRTAAAAAMQAATLDFAVMIFIRCTADMIAACAKASSSPPPPTTVTKTKLSPSGDHRASVERWTAATMTLRKALRTLALLHALLGN
jgi:hypothetical protein